MRRRKRYDSRFKAEVAIEAIKNQRTVAQIASEYGVHPNQVSQWKKQVLDQLPELFTNGRSKSTTDSDPLVDELYRQIGQLKVELDWLQKKTQLLRWPETTTHWKGVWFTVGCQAMRATGTVKSLVLLPTGGWIVTKSALYATDRWAVHKDTFLRRTSIDGMASLSGACCQSKACGSVDDKDGIGCDLSAV